MNQNHKRYIDRFYVVGYVGARPVSYGPFMPAAYSIDAKCVENSVATLEHADGHPIVVNVDAYPDLVAALKAARIALQGYADGPATEREIAVERIVNAALDRAERKEA